MFKHLIFLLVLFISIPSLASDTSYQLQIQLTIPKLEVDPYHKPFIAIWLETPKRKGKQTLAVWYDDEEWLKDLRQWWRKLGRRDSLQGNAKEFDGASGATRRPGSYTLNYTTQALTPGDYVLHIEASRESGGREHLKQAIYLGKEQQTFTLSGQHELGDITITVLSQ
ncbi:DUF2271 domain-containing protein [Bacterioplanoides sp. SCSIO 12839]|uniref:DUF2271 domain-containing protein n=1 Tax=Bacterioplanoides sp. SCSIO 12839 TaxID=2829569 RepID=UPI002102C561|nr:DUF2271 domain-containing protein [Bacterioplanoides sp. SCSIO 12839]UTW49337.1 DUF2271 domain-containing protein [Bacterioplanoides sp. SCSIO 12839]